MMIRQLLIVALLAMSCDRVYAGNGGESDARAVAMGRAQVAVAENTEAFLWNPALLGLSQNQQSLFTMQIIGFGFRHGNNVLSISDYNKYNGRAFSEKDKKDFLKLFGSDNALRFNGDAEIRAFGFSYRNYSLNASLRGDGNVSVPRGLFDLTLSNYAVGESRLSGRGGGAGNFLASVDMSAGYPIKDYFPTVFSRFKEVTAGMTLRYVRGFEQASLTRMSGVVEQSDSVITRGRYDALTSKGGNGMGLDLGMAAKLNRQWTFGISLHNVFSQVQWSNSNKAYHGQFLIRASDIFDVDFRNDYKDSLGVVHPDTGSYNSSKFDSSYATGTYSRRLPMILRLGAAFQLNRRMLFAADYEHHLNNTAGSSIPRIAAGMEYRLSDAVFLRSGLSVGGDNRGFNFSGGAGFVRKNTRFDIATNNLEGLITLKRFSFALNVKTTLN